jgi:hypothetical protein
VLLLLFTLINLRPYPQYSQLLNPSIGTGLHPQWDTPIEYLWDYWWYECWDDDIIQLELPQQWEDFWVPSAT